MRISGLVCLFLASLLTGCAAYLTPGGPALLGEFRSDGAVAGGIGAERDNAAPSFPATIAIVRVQAPQFLAVSPVQSRSNGHFSVVSAGEFPEPAALQGISMWPAVAGVAVIDPSILPEAFESFGDLRLAAAKMSAEVLLIYTVDSSFRVNGRVYGPATSFPIGGAKPDGNDAITVTASALFTDVRTGATLGMASATALASDPASAWSSAESIDRKRMETERKAVELLLADAQNTWVDFTRRTR